MESDDDSDSFCCAICGIREGDSSNLNQSSLQTNATVRCGHQFCMSCVERELSRKKVFPCQICGEEVKRVTLSTRTLDDIQCEKDTTWRKKILKVYNKVQKDFTCLVEYNNYLEEVEDVIYAIVNEEANAEECKAKYRKQADEDKSQINIRLSQRAAEDTSILSRINAQQRDAERKKREHLDREKTVKLFKERYKFEAKEVLLGRRENVTKKYVDARIDRYKEKLSHTDQGANFESNVRYPPVCPQDKHLTREEKRRCQSAGGGIESKSTQTHDRNWQLTVSSLFFQNL